MHLLCSATLFWGRGRLLHQRAASIASLLVCFWVVEVAVASKAASGTEPWLVMFKKGTDGQQLFDRLCPSISIGDTTAFGLGDSNSILPNAALLTSPDRQMLLNCTAQFTGLLNGFAGYFTLKQLEQIKALYKNSIDFVISDKKLEIDTPKGMLEATAINTRRLLAVQEDATWGLDIIDQGFLPLDHQYHYTNNGTGVHVYVLDTGVKSKHEEFKIPGSSKTRVSLGYDAISNIEPGSTEDCHGHGTHVAAVIAGNTYGVAKNATIHPVRVLDCQGRALLSSLIKGLEWVASNHIKPAVVHMSVEGGFSSLVNKAVDKLLKTQHVHVVVSAGNSGQDACRASPASAPAAVTVGAIDQLMQRWAYSNWGACVDIFAPGVSILSAVSSSDSSVALKTGTSMAAPFVSGVVAAYLETHPGASPEEVQEKLYQSAIRGAIADDPQGFATMFPSSRPTLLDISSTPNRMLLSNVASQAHLTPGVLHIDSATASAEVSVALTSQPTSQVSVRVTVPNAWDGSPLADLVPAQLTFDPDTWNASQTVALLPKPVCVGDYYITFSFSGDEMLPSVHTALVHDSRKKSGDSADMARIITRLPFNDTGDSSVYTDNYACQVTDAAPDVVYQFKAPEDMDVIVSTCGSSYDTKLIVTTNLDDTSSYLCNDDDRGCTSNTACSLLDVSFKAEHTYYIVVDGYAGASGEYSLSLTCPGCKERSSQDPPTVAAPLIAALLHVSMNAAEYDSAGISAGTNTPSSTVVASQVGATSSTRGDSLSAAVGGSDGEPSPEQLILARIAQNTNSRKPSAPMGSTKVQGKSASRLTAAAWSQAAKLTPTAGKKQAGSAASTQPKNTVSDSMSPTGCAADSSSKQQTCTTTDWPQMNVEGQTAYTVDPRTSVSSNAVDGIVFMEVPESRLGTAGAAGVPVTVSDRA